jgi:hypothetical protein
VNYAKSTIDLMLKRERLLAQCAAQRDELAALTLQFEGPIRLADRGIAVVHYLRDHPLVLGVLVAALAVLKRRGLWKWVPRGVAAWRAYRAFGRSAFRSKF